MGHLLSLPYRARIPPLLIPRHVPGSDGDLADAVMTLPGFDLAEGFTWLRRRFEWESGLGATGVYVLMGSDVYVWSRRHGRGCICLVP